MWLPNQFGSRPTFDTPMNPPVGLPQVLPATICLTVVPGPFTCRSKSSVSFHIGTRNTV
jgi:hypothetical protein